MPVKKDIIKEETEPTTKEKNKDKEQLNKQELADRFFSERHFHNDIPRYNEKISNKLISGVILLSLIFGAAGSVLGSVYLAPLYNKIPQSLGQDVKTVQVDEQSAVVDVVKKSSPAVVSIIISKDLNKVPGFSSSPFDSGPFSLDPFFQQRNPNSSQPNVQEVGGGSGFIISSDGLIVTNKHVVEDATATYTVLTNDGKKFDATILSRDPINDLALV